MILGNGNTKSSPKPKAFFFYHSLDWSKLPNYIKIFLIDAEINVKAQNNGYLPH